TDSPIAIAHAVLHLTNLFYFQSAGSRKTWFPPALRRRQEHVSRQRAITLARSTQQESSNDKTWQEFRRARFMKVEMLRMSQFDHPLATQALQQQHKGKPMRRI